MGKWEPRVGARVGLLCLLAALSILAYGVSLGLPFIADDYVQIRIARDYGPVSGWARAASDPLYRCRETSLILTYWTERFFGLDPLPYNLSSLLLHIVNSWLVFALGVWRVIGWRVSSIAAAFFVVHEGHQEAVIWYSALPELLVFFFVILSLLAWRLWLCGDRYRVVGWIASLAAFALALASKESAVVVVPLIVLITYAETRQWRQLLWTLPFAIMALAYTLAIFASSADHLHFNDAGTFSLRAPFVMVLLRSSFRLLWFWGFLALAVIFYLRPRGMMLILAIAGTWIVITSLPYSFLTYMPRVPSRHTYMAGVGPALLVAVAVLAMHQSAQYSKRFIPALVCLIILGQNCGYLWTKKLQQYRARAEPTLQLIEFARKTPASRIFVRCFPYSIWIAHYALELELKKEAVEVKEEAEGLSPVFCYRGIM